MPFANKCQCMSTFSPGRERVSLVLIVGTVKREPTPYVIGHGHRAPDNLDVPGTVGANKYPPGFGRAFGGQGIFPDVREHGGMNGYDDSSGRPPSYDARHARHARDLVGFPSFTCVASVLSNTRP